MSRICLLILVVLVSPLSALQGQPHLAPADYPVITNASSQLKLACFRETDVLCLQNRRFEISVEWTDFDGRTGSGHVVPVGSGDSGIFWFFDADNWEMLVKVLDGCTINGRFWVFAAATTNVEYTLMVSDTSDGSSKSYFNPLGFGASTVADTDAFSNCAASGMSPILRNPERLQIGDDFEKVQKGIVRGLCTPDSDRLCLNGSRFSVQVDWRDSAGNTGSARVVPVDAPPLGPDSSGLFYFFDADNWEMLVKVLDGCAANDRFWVFSAATTDVEYTLKVIDEVTGQTRSYFNPLGNAAVTLTDTDAFATCPQPIPKPELLVFADPSSLPVTARSTITVVARQEDGSPVEAGQRIRLLASGGLIQRQAFTDHNGEAQASFAAGIYPGAGSVTAILGASDPATTELSIRDAVAFIGLAADRLVIFASDDSDIDLTALVSNALGEPVSGVTVIFESPIGSFESDGLAVTDVLGQTFITLTISGDESPPYATFDVTATVRSELGSIFDTLTMRIVGQ